MGADSDSLRAVCQKVFNPAACGWGEAKGQKFVYQDVGNDGVEGGGIVHKKHPDAAVSVFEVAQSSVEDDGYGVVGGSV